MVGVRTEHSELDDVAGGFGGLPSSPEFGGMGESSAFPPLGIFSGEMEGDFIRSNSLSLTDAISSEK